MSRWDDPQILARARQLGGRVARAVAEAKRAEAAERNARTPHDRTRAHREGRCPCWTAPVALSSRRWRKTPVECPWPDKGRYTTRQAARLVLRKMAPHRRRQGLHAYRCDAKDHWHLGRRPRRAVVLWKAAA